jgi:hypothetical protein
MICTTHLQCILIYKSQFSNAKVLSKLAQVVVLLICVQEVLVSNFERDH